MLSKQEKETIIGRILQNGWKAVVFDIDGTLFPHISANDAIFTKLGKAEDMKGHEQGYAAGSIDNDVVANALALHFAGQRTIDLAAALSRDHLILDAKDICQELRRAGVPVLIATVTWRFVADWAASELGGEAISGVELEERDGMLTGKVIRHAYDRDKTRALEEWCASKDIGIRDCIAIGDSRSDLDLFRKVGLALAINPSGGAREAADYAGEFETLGDLLARAPLNKPTTPRSL